MRCLDGKGVDMNLGELKNRFVSELESHYPKSEVTTFFFMLAERYLKVNRADALLKVNKVVPDEVVEHIDNAIARLKKYEPIQYILGDTDFYGLNFIVEPGVLIPRPETEELVDLIIKDTPLNASYQLLDIGTGSGCIAITLGNSLKQCSVTAMDISEKALAIASKNSSKNNVEIRFELHDILSNSNWAQHYDIVVSNPPYVRMSEKQAMKANVLDHEPEIALFVEDSDPLTYYEAILKFCITNLNTGGRLYFEINEYLGNDMVELVQRYEFRDVELIKDLAGKDRFIKAKK